MNCKELTQNHWDGTCLRTEPSQSRGESHSWFHRFEPLGPAVLSSWSQEPIHSFFIFLSQFELSFSSSRKGPDENSVIRTKTWMWEAAGSGPAEAALEPQPERGGGRVLPTRDLTEPFPNNTARQQPRFSSTLSFIKPYNGSQRNKAADRSGQPRCTTHSCPR